MQKRIKKTQQSILKLWDNCKRCKKGIMEIAKLETMERDKKYLK